MRKLNKLLLKVGKPVIPKYMSTRNRDAETGTALPQDTPITLSLRATRVTGTAPMGVIFEATATSPSKRARESFHDIEYVWSFDDPGAYSALFNKPIWGTNRNVAYGPKSIYVFPNPGRFTVVCTAHDGQNPPRTATIEIVVSDPNEVFSQEKTAVVSTLGNFTGKPHGAREFLNVNQALSAMQGSQNYRILLRRGERFIDRIVVSEKTGSGKRILVGAFGDKKEANPLLDMSKRGDGDGVYGIRFAVAEGVATELTIDRVNYLGHSDPTSPESPSDSGGGLVDFTGNPFSKTAHKTIWGSHIKNAGGQSIKVFSNSSIENIYIGDCFIDGWNDYGILLSEGGFFGVCGSTIQQPRGTRSGRGKGNTRWPDHGPFRASRPTGPCIFSNCDLASFNSWNARDDNYSMQPCIRWDGGVEDYSNGAPLEVPSLVIDRVRSEGTINAPHSMNGSQRRNRRVLIDRLYMVLTSHQPMPIGFGGTTWRNVIAVIPNVRSLTNGINGSGAIRDQYSWGAGLSDANADRIEFYSSIYADLRSDENADNALQNAENAPHGFSPPRTSVSDSFVGNNIYYAPNRRMVPSFTEHDPLDITPGFFEPVFDGKRYEVDDVETQYGTPMSDISSYRPLDGSSAIGGAVGKVSIIDFNGELRSKVLESLTRSTPSMGPYEPDLER